jgi:hypothetical protein
MDSRRSIPRRSCASPADNGGVSRSTIISALLPDSEVNQIRRGTRECRKLRTAWRSALISCRNSGTKRFPLGVLMPSLLQPELPR